MTKWSVVVTDGRELPMEADDFSVDDDGTVEFFNRHQYVRCENAFEGGTHPIGGLITLGPGQTVEAMIERIAYFERAKVICVVKNAEQ